MMNGLVGEDHAAPEHHPVGCVENNEARAAAMDHVGDARHMTIPRYLGRAAGDSGWGISLVGAHTRTPWIPAINCEA